MSSFCEDLENLLTHDPDSANQSAGQQDDQYGLENLTLTEVQAFDPFRWVQGHVNLIKNKHKKGAKTIYNSTKKCFYYINLLLWYSQSSLILG